MTCSYPGCLNEARANSHRPNAISLCADHKGKTLKAYMRNYMLARRHHDAAFRDATNAASARYNWVKRNELRTNVLQTAQKNTCDGCGSTKVVALGIYNLRRKALTVAEMKRYASAPHKARLNVMALCPNCVMRGRKINPKGRVQRRRAKMLNGARCCRCGEKDPRVLIIIKRDLSTECASCYTIGLRVGQSPT